MPETFAVNVIARLRCDFTDKFGVPRQAGLAEHVCSRVVFEPEYRNPDALRGIEGFSHLWLLWRFDRVRQKDWSPTVRPPRLGGNRRMGVFATRSPFRPNPVGLSCVRLLRVEWDAPDGPTPTPAPTPPAATPIPCRRDAWRWSCRRSWPPCSRRKNAWRF